MKKWLSLLFIGLSNISLASSPDTLSLNGISMVQLQKIQSNSVNIDIQYPGEIYSQLCSIIMRAANNSHGLDKMMTSRFKFTHHFSQEPMPYDVDKFGVVTFKLMENSYVDGITITTLDGKSIASNMDALLRMKDGTLGDRIAFFAGSC